jgi:hypothetical protein
MAFQSPNPKRYPQTNHTELHAHWKLLIFPSTVGPAAPALLPLLRLKSDRRPWWLSLHSILDLPLFSFFTNVSHASVFKDTFDNMLKLWILLPEETAYIHGYTTAWVISASSYLEVMFKKICSTFSPWGYWPLQGLQVSPQVDDFQMCALSSNHCLKS